MEGTTNFTTIKTQMDLIGMLRILKQVCNRGSFGGIHDPDVLVSKEQKGLLVFRQKPKEDATSYSEKLMSRYDNLIAVSGGYPFGLMTIESIVAQIDNITLERYTAKANAGLDLISRCDLAYKGRE